MTYFAHRRTRPMTFRTPGLYRLIRHPIYIEQGSAEE